MAYLLKKPQSQDLAQLQALSFVTNVGFVEHEIYDLTTLTFSKTAQVRFLINV